MSRVALFVVALALIVARPVTGAGLAAQPAPQPVALPCATNVGAQVLGNAAPETATGQSLVLVRIVFGLDGGGGRIGAHTHPGTLVASVESGTLGFTLIEEEGTGTMSVMRAAPAGTPAAAEPLAPGEEVELAAGDWFVETGMLHTARNLGDEPATVLLSGLIEAGQPLTRCVDEAPSS